MRKLLSSCRKESLLIIRDVPGMLILFFMPVILMCVVIIAQEYTLRNEMGRTKIIFVDESRSEFSRRLNANLVSSGFFQTDTLLVHGKASEGEAKDLLVKGSYPAALIIGPNDSVIRLIFAPSVTGSFRSTLSAPLKFLVKATQSKELLEKMLASSAGDMRPLIQEAVDRQLEQLPDVGESIAGTENSEIRPTAVQNIVPGFILFAMFFIVIPLASSIIAEKNEGAFQRLRTLPVELSTILGSKVLVYLAVCFFQFFLMMAVGKWGFPVLLDLPGLETGNNFPAVMYATFSASLAAIGFGLLVGSISGTMAQASLFGSVMVVLLGVISGTFLPVHVLPDAVKTLSLISPMRWGIDNYLDVFIRGKGIGIIFPRSLLLLGFFGLAMMFSIYIFAKKKN